MLKVNDAIVANINASEGYTAIAPPAHPCVCGGGPLESASQTASSTLTRPMSILLPPAPTKKLNVLAYPGLLSCHVDTNSQHAWS